MVTEQERVVGTHEHHHGHHMGTDRVSGEEVCGQKTFTEVEDRPVVRERVERIVEHRPVEKQVGVSAATFFVCLQLCLEDVNPIDLWRLRLTAATLFCSS